MGHANAWEYTPRQMTAFLFIAHRRQRRDMRDKLGLLVVALHGDEKSIKRRLRELAE